ncbi:hypothetical protein F5888DRAFT_1634708 [Russula emetica]|nr:hypothetical protein F5888DRAFT_1634708 [Russula emetica]
MRAVGLMEVSAHGAAAVVVVAKENVVVVEVVAATVVMCRDARARDWGQLEVVCVVVYAVLPIVSYWRGRILCVSKNIIAKRGEKLHTPRVRLITIWFGVNDASLPGFTQHVPLSLISENLTTMVHVIRAPESQWYSPETRLLLIIPPPIHVPSMNVERQPARTSDVTKAYAEEVKRLATEAENVPV